MAQHALRILFLTVPVSIAATALVNAGALEDCNSDETKRKLSGCTVLINKGLHSNQEISVAYSRRSNAHLASGKWDQAVADRAKALNLQPNDLAHQSRLSEAYRFRAHIRATKKKFDSAIADYSEAVRLDPSNHQAYFGRSSVHIQKKNFDNAIADLSIAIRVAPGNEQYKLQLSKLHEYRGHGHSLKTNFELAIVDYTEAIRLNSKRAPLYVNRGTAYVGMKDWDRGIADFTEAMRIDTDLIDAYLHRAESFHARGALTQGIADLDTVIQRDPKNATAILRRGLAREENEQRDLAISDYRAVLKLEPAHKLAKASLERLERSPITKGVSLSPPPLPPTENPPKPLSGVPGDHFTSYANHDLAGEDLRNLKDLNHEDCAAACRSQARCQAYAFDKWNRWCFLKSSVGTLRLDPKYVSGVLQEGGPPPRSSSVVVIELYRNKAFPCKRESCTTAHFA